MIDTNFIGKSNVIRKLLKDIPRLANLQKPLLLIGPKGVGKTTLAGLIHAHAKRNGKPAILNAASSTEAEIREVLEKQPKHYATVVFQDIEAFSFLYQAKISAFIKNLSQKTPLQVIIIARNDITESNKQGRILEDFF